MALAGAAEANPRIRTLVDQESTTLAVVEPFRIERLVLGVPPEPPPGFATTRIDSRTIGDGKPGPVTLKLLEMFRDLTKNHTG